MFVIITFAGHFGKVYAGKLYKDEEHKEFISKVAVKCLIGRLINIELEYVEVTSMALL